MTKPDPYGKNDKPSRLEVVHRKVQSISNATSLITGAAFVIIGIGALIAAAVTSKQLLFPLGAFAILFGAIRLWLWSRTR